MLSRWLLQQWNVPGVAAISQRWPRCHPFGSSPEQIVVVDCNFGAGSHHCARHRHHCAYAPNASQTSTFAANEARSRIILCGRWAATGHQCRWQHAESKFFSNRKLWDPFDWPFICFHSGIHATLDDIWIGQRFAIAHTAHADETSDADPWDWQRTLRQSVSGQLAWRPSGRQNFLQPRRRVMETRDRNLQHNPVASRKYPRLHWLRYDIAQFQHPIVGADRLLSTRIPLWSLATQSLNTSRYDHHLPFDCQRLGSFAHGNFRHRKQTGHRPSRSQIEKHFGSRERVLCHCRFRIGRNAYAGNK